MIQEFGAMMMFMVMAKFMMNDIPHALGLVDSHPATSHSVSTFPEDAKRDLTFCRHMWDLEQTAGRSLSREEVLERWSKWKALRYRSKTEDERKLIHSTLYGTEELPPRGTGSWKW